MACRIMQCKQTIRYMTTGYPHAEFITIRCQYLEAHDGPCTFITHLGRTLHVDNQHEIGTHT